MCGIVGYVGAKPVVPVLIGALRRLEYRGYDSAGIALVAGGRIEVRDGKVEYRTTNTEGQEDITTWKR